MSQFYGQHVSKTLAEKIEEFCRAPQEMTSLADEVAIARMNCAESLKLAAPCFDPSHPQAAKMNDTVKAQAIALLQESLNHVRFMVESMAKIENSARDKVSLSQMNYFVQAVMRIVKNRCEEAGQGDLAKLIGEQLSQIKLPEDPNMDTKVSLEFD